MAGITAFGGYVPRYRLNRQLIYKDIGWMNPSTIGNSKGEKAVANFDEDSITMSVAAGIDALGDMDREKVEGVYFASTTMPYKERLNAGIIMEALGLSEQIRSADFSGGLKAGTTALINAMETVESGRIDNIVVCACDCRIGKPGSAQEMIFGDAAAAFVVGTDNVIAEFKGSFSTTHDFVDHYRGATNKSDRQWEDRWIRDLGYNQFLPEVINGLLDKYHLKITDFAKIIYPCHYVAVRRKLAKVLGFDPEVDHDNLQTVIGENGIAQPLVMLAHALESAKPGDKLLVVGFGSGCEAVYLEVTENITKFIPANGISGCLENRRDLEHYSKYLVWRGMMEGDIGLAGEEDLWTRWSALWRRRKFVLGFWGGKCSECGTEQIPAQPVCVNPECGAVNAQEPCRFSHKTGQVASFTGDMLAASLSPPTIYGEVMFEGGGKYMLDFTDCELDDLQLGTTVTVSFRRRFVDAKRDISGYFWKAVPVKEAN
jgi:hydroxymethylglutaryl-CoA synthase